MAICKMCGAQVLALIPKKRMGVCPICAAKLDAEQEAREATIIAVLKEKTLQVPLEIKTRLEERNIKVASSTLYETLSRLVDHGRIKKSGPYYFVEA